jgi:hypothetical protein
MIKPGGPWRIAEQVEAATLHYVYWFNHHRLLENNGDLPPIELEQAPLPSSQLRPRRDRMTQNTESPDTPEAFTGPTAGKPRSTPSRPPSTDACPPDRSNTHKIQLHRKVDTPQRTESAGAHAAELATRVSDLRTQIVDQLCVLGFWSASCCVQWWSAASVQACAAASSKRTPTSSARWPAA